MPGTLDPSSQFILVTPSDSATLVYNGVEKATRGISFAVAGALAIKDDEDNTVIIPSDALAAGIIHPIITNKILSTGTDVTGLVAWF